MEKGAFQVISLQFLRKMQLYQSSVGVHVSFINGKA